jgi:hypothetical protein
VFRIENNVFGANIGFPIVDNELTGGDLAHAHEGQDPLPQTLVVLVEFGEFPGYGTIRPGGEFTYEMSTGQAKVYVLRSILLYIPRALLHRYVKE